MTNIVRLTKYDWEWIALSVGACAALFSILTVMVSAIQFVRERDSRRRVAVFSAWSIVSSTEGKRANGGRSDALKQLKENNQSFAGMVLDGAVLDNLDLSKSDLSYSSLRNVDLNRCSFNNVSLIHASLAHGTFRDHCEFRRALFSETDLRDAHLSDDDLDESRFHIAIGDDSTTFDGASMRDAEIANSSFVGSTFDNSDLSKAVFTATSISLARFVNAKLNGCRLSAVDASNAQFAKASLQDCLIERHTLLRDADFSRVHAERAIYNDVDLSGAVFFGAFLAGTTFQNCILTGANFTSADLRSATFEKCDLSGAIFTAADVNAGAFSNCKGNLPSLVRR